MTENNNVTAVAGNEKVTAQVKKIIAEKLSIDLEKVMEESTLVDLGADSLDQVELVMQCEEEFDIEIPDDDLEKIANVGEMISYILQKVSN